MVLNNFKDVEKELAKYIPAVRNITGKDITLQRIKPLMESLGNPQYKVNIVHVAGTSGKTSTCYYLAALLTATGKKTGLTVSPHIENINERLQINLEPLQEQDFCRELAEFLELIKDVDPEPTYFELLIAFVYWYFAKTEVDYAIIETGLGGMHDATNITDQPDKVCVITDIGLDHMQVLGYSLPEIARQKAGIIHTGNQTFMHAQSEEVMAVFRTHTEKVNANLNVLSNEQENHYVVNALAFKKLPAYQQRNFLLAFHAYRHISSRDNLPDINQESLSSVMKVLVPGRMDIRNVNGKTVILDGAHNGQKMEAFVRSFKELYPNQKATIMLGLKEGKEYEAVLPLLKPICSKLIVTAFKTSQDLPIVSIESSVLADAATHAGINDVEVINDTIAATEELLTSDTEIRIVTGSFYLLAAVMPSML